MRRLRLFALLAFCAAVGFVPPHLLLAQTGAPVQIGSVKLTAVGDWEAGTLTDLLATNNNGGELRLAPGKNQGTFVSGLIPANFRANAAGAIWHTETPKGTQLLLELRAGPSGDQLSDWLPLIPGDAHLQGDDSSIAMESVLPLADDVTFLQLRATFSATAQNASPELSDLLLNYYNTIPGPATVAGLPRVVAVSGASTLTVPPQLIERSVWSGGAAVPTSIERRQPVGVIIHQIGTDSVTASLPFLRALLNYHTRTLGYDDLPYHYLIDRDGTLFEGRAGGPTSYSSRFAAGDTAIQIGLIGSTTPTSATLSTLSGLVAWLGQAYAIEPSGKHIIPATSDTPALERPNILFHSDLVPNANDPSDGLRQQLKAIRQAADDATVRARWYFAEGNTKDYAERLAVVNPTAASATVRFILLPQPGTPVIREVTVAAGGRFDLVLNDLLSDAADVPAIVEANAAVIAERYMDFGSDISIATGVNQLSRVWYFAEGSTDGTNQTFLLLFNPQPDQVQATITYIRDDGIAAKQEVTIPGLQRRVVIVGDKLTGVHFGMRVVASRPIVAERTMIFGQGSTLQGGGVETSAGVVNLSRRWYFAEGNTEAPFQMAILVLNPNAQPVDAAITFQTADGTSLTRRYAIPATTRLTINVNEFVPQLGVATSITTDRPVVAERSMTWNNGLAGSAGPGAVNPAYTWRFADGRTLDPFQEFLVVSNPGKNPAQVSATYLLGDGTQVNDPAFTLAGGARQVIAVHTQHPGQQAIAATVRATQPIVVERSLYHGNPRTTGSQGGETVLGIPGE